MITNLERRVARLENAAERKREGLPPVLFSFIEPIRDADDVLISERCTGYWLLPVGGPEQWFDENMNPLPQCPA